MRKLYYILLLLILTQTSNGVCQDTDNDATDLYGNGCASYVGNEAWCGSYDSEFFNSYYMCCACDNGSGVTGGVNCEDTNYGATDFMLNGCDWYVGNEENCGTSSATTEGNSPFNSLEMCCACNGGCQDTNDGAVDADGDGCSAYVNNL